MGRPSRMSVQKRQRERKKAEKAEHKRMTRTQARDADRLTGSQVAQASELEAYGVVPATSDPRNER